MDCVDRGGGNTVGPDTCVSAVFCGKETDKTKAHRENETVKPELVPHEEVNDKKSPGPYMRAAALTAMAFVILAIELVVYSWIANFLR